MAVHETPFAPAENPGVPAPEHQTALGQYFLGDSEQQLSASLGRELHSRIQLVLTSPPFPLNNKKSYGNLEGDAYLDWFTDLAETFAPLLSPDGSIVIELGNAWSPGRPVQSLLPLEALIGFAKNPHAGLRVCQQFVCYNPARLPTPAQWVAIERIRATDSYTHVWWFAKTDTPKADNRRVLRPYSASMKALLKRQSYNSGKRPSEHTISENGFLADRGGSIPPNLFEIEAMDPNRVVRLPNAFSLANTGSNDFFMRTCRSGGITPHPARMHPGLAAFFVKFLTDEGDMVLDPFAGSNTTGYVAQKLGRRWISIEAREEYAEQSRIRLSDPTLRREAPSLRERSRS